MNISDDKTIEEAVENVLPDEPAKPWRMDDAGGYINSYLAIHRPAVVALVRCADTMEQQRQAMGK